MHILMNIPMLQHPALPLVPAEPARWTIISSSEHSLNWQGLDLRWAYGDLLPGICRHTHCMHAAHDVLHDAFLRFALTPNREHIVQPHAYLRTVVRNVLVDNHRDANRFVPLFDEQEDKEGGQHEHIRCSPSPEQLTDLQQRLEALQRVIDCLPPRCREVFWLFRIEGLKQPDIASRLGISLNMVEKHIMRALIDLRAARDLID
jgi:RNA polymerase sigma factor (sigma-70 family)